MYKWQVLLSEFAAFSEVWLAIILKRMSMERLNLQACEKVMGFKSTKRLKTTNNT